MPGTGLPSKINKKLMCHARAFHAQARDRGTVQYFVKYGTGEQPFRSPTKDNYFRQPQPITNFVGCRYGYCILTSDVCWCPAHVLASELESPVLFHSRMLCTNDFKRNRTWHPNSPPVPTSHPPTSGLYPSLVELSLPLPPSSR